MLASGTIYDVIYSRSSKMRAGPALESGTGAAKEVFGQEETSAGRRVKAQAHRLIRNSVHFLTLMDSFFLSTHPWASRVDGLPGALLTVTLHWLVAVGLNLPMLLVGVVHLGSLRAERQSACAFNDMIKGHCTVPWRWPAHAQKNLLNPFRKPC